MADTYIGVGKGLAVETVTTGASTTSKAIEVRFADTVTKKQDVLLGLEQIKKFILTKENLPAD